MRTIVAPLPDALAELFARHGWLAAQSASFRAALLRRAHLVRIERGEAVYNEGDPPGGIYGIFRGGIAGFVNSTGRGEVLAHILREGDWFGVGPSLTGSERYLSFRAAEPSELLRVPLAQLQALEADDPSTAHRIGALADAGARVILDVAADLLVREADRRIAATLLRVTGATRRIAPDGTEGFRITQAELGEMANASRNHTNRTLDQFRKAGWITLGYNRIIILDAAALAAYAEGGARGVAMVPRHRMSVHP